MSLFVFSLSLILVSSLSSLFSLFSFLLSILSLPYPVYSTLLYSISVFYTLAQLNQGSSAQPESSLFNQSILLSFTLYSFFLSLHSLSSLPSHSHPSLLTPVVTILAVSRFQSQRLFPAQPLLLSHTYTRSLSLPTSSSLHTPFYFLIFFISLLYFYRVFPSSILHLFIYFIFSLYLSCLSHSIIEAWLSLPLK